ncbi:hypothetical protein [Kitasatospora sp. NPDC004272]
MDRPHPFRAPDRPAAPPLTEADRLVVERLLGVALPAAFEPADTAEHDAAEPDNTERADADPVDAPGKG